RPSGRRGWPMTASAPTSRCPRASPRPAPRPSTSSGPTGTRPSSTTPRGCPITSCTASLSAPSCKWAQAAMRNRSPSSASRRNARMADPHTTQLITAPKPIVTRYNRLVMYAGLAAVALVVCTYLLVRREHGRRAASAPPMHLVSPPTPLVTDLPKVKPEPPPEPQPQPPPQPAVSVPPVQQSSLPAPKK